MSSPYLFLVRFTFNPLNSASLLTNWLNLLRMGFEWSCEKKDWPTNGKLYKFIHLILHPWTEKKNYSKEIISIITYNSEWISNQKQWNISDTYVVYYIKKLMWVFHFFFFISLQYSIYYMFFIRFDIRSETSLCNWMWNIVK
jgi:hypothetical protein